MKRIDEIQLDSRLQITKCQKCGIPSHNLILTTISWGGSPPCELHINLCPKCHENTDKHQ